MSESAEESGQQVEVNPAAFEELLSNGGGSETPPRDPSGEGLVNLDMILDVSVPVTVCVGSVKKKISEILAMTPGHVLDLNRFAGDPVDLVVNGMLIARGEVVVVDDHYGMRITEIVSPKERVASSTAI